MRLLDEVLAWWREHAANVPVDPKVFEQMFGDFYAWNRDTKSAIEQSKSDPGFYLPRGSRMAVLQRLNGNICYYVGPNVSVRQTPSSIEPPPTR
jgi:hypothetical protein